MDATRPSSFLGLWSLFLRVYVYHLYSLVHGSVADSMRVLNDYRGEMNGDVRLTPEDIKMIAYCLSWCEGDEAIGCEAELYSFGKLADQFRAMDIHFQEKAVDSDS